MKKLTLKGHFEELNAQLAIKKEIARECGVTKRTVDNWISGKTPIPILAQKKINKLLKIEFSYEN